MGATLSPYIPVQPRLWSMLLLYLATSLLHTQPKINVQFIVGFTWWAPPHRPSLRCYAAPTPRSCFAWPPRSYVHDKKNPSTSRRGSIPSPFTPVQHGPHSTLLLYLASLQDTRVCRYATIWMCLSSVVLFLVWQLELKLPIQVLPSQHPLCNRWAELQKMVWCDCFFVQYNIAALVRAWHVLGGKPKVFGQLKGCKFLARHVLFDPFVFRFLFPLNTPYELLLAHSISCC